MLGKLTSKDLIENVLSVVSKRRKEVLVSCGVGEDCAAIKCRDYMLVTSDPITAACANMGKLAIYISSNDIAASGGESIAAFLTIIAPENTELSMIKEVMLDAESVAKTLNIEIAGGHTEYSDCVNRMIVSATMVGRTFTDKIYSNKNIKAGDSVILTRMVAKEYSFIKASDDAKMHSYLLPKELKEAMSYINEISVTEEAKVLAYLPVSTMHDVTEGGVLGAIEEIMQETGLGCNISLKAIPVSSVSKKIAKIYGDDVYRVISSGSMLIISSSPKQILKELKKNNIDAVKIGEINDSGALIYD